LQPHETIATRPEHRQLTIMFADMVGSTALGTRFEREDVREVEAKFRDCIKVLVDRFDGFVARYMGDGALVYFGYPNAHEDDAERRYGLARHSRGRDGRHRRGTFGNAQRTYRLHRPRDRR
jgi:class 3 adenylate cyclase